MRDLARCASSRDTGVLGGTGVVGMADAPATAAAAPPTPPPPSPLVLLTDLAPAPPVAFARASYCSSSSSKSMSSSSIRSASSRREFDDDEMEEEEGRPRRLALPGRMPLLPLPLALPDTKEAPVLEYPESGRDAVREAGALEVRGDDSDEGDRSDFDGRAPPLPGRDAAADPAGEESSELGRVSELRPSCRERSSSSSVRSCTQRVVAEFSESRTHCTEECERSNKSASLTAQVHLSHLCAAAFVCETLLLLLLVGARSAECLAAAGAVAAAVPPSAASARPNLLYM